MTVGRSQLSRTLVAPPFHSLSQPSLLLKTERRDEGKRKEKERRERNSLLEAKLAQFSREVADNTYKHTHKDCRHVLHQSTTTE